DQHPSNEVDGGEKHAVSSEVRRLADADGTLGDRGGGTHQGEAATVERRLLQNLAVAPAGGDLVGFRFAERDGHHRLPLEILQAAYGDTRQTVDSHLSEGAGRPAHVGAAVVHGPVHQLEDL